MKTIRVTARGPEGWVVKTNAGQHAVIVDQPESMGGSDSGPTPLDYQLIALGSCLVTLAKIVAGQQKINLRSVEVDLSGDINLAVLRGQEKDDRAGFKNIHVDVRIDADLTLEEKKLFMDEVDKRCPISENLMHTTPVSVSLIE